MKSKIVFRSNFERSSSDLVGEPSVEQNWILRTSSSLTGSSFSADVWLQNVKSLRVACFKAKVVYPTKIQNFEISSCLSDK